MNNKVMHFVVLNNECPVQKGTSSGSRSGDPDSDLDHDPDILCSV